MAPGRSLVQTLLMFARHSLLLLVIVFLGACGGEPGGGAVDGGPSADAFEPDGGPALPSLELTYLGGVGGSPDDEIGVSLLAAESTGELFGAARGFELLLGDGSSFGYDRDTEFVGPMPFDSSTLRTHGADSVRIGSDDLRWIFVAGPTFLDGSPVDGPAWIDTETGTAVPWPDDARPSGAEYDAAGRLWTTACATGALDVAGVSVGAGECFLVGVDGAGLSGAFVFGRSVEGTAFRVAADGALLLVANAPRASDAELFGQPLLADHGALFRVDLATGGMTDRWDATVPLDLRKTPEGMRVHALVADGGVDFAGFSYETLGEGMTTWLMLEWDGEGELPLPQRWPVHPANVEPNGVVWQLGLPGQERAIELAVEEVGPASGEPLWGRLDDDGQLALGVRAVADEVFAWVVGDVVRVVAVSTTTVEIGRARYEPLAGEPRTLHLVAMNPMTGEVTFHLAVPGSPSDFPRSTSVAHLGPSHVLVDRLNADGTYLDLSLVSLETGASRTLDLPTVDGTSCRLVLSGPDGRSDWTVTPWEPARDLIALRVHCDGAGHTVTFGGHSVDYQGTRSMTIFRATLTD